MREMKANSENRAYIQMTMEGLERMARLYKNKKTASRSLTGKLRRFLHMVRHGKFSELKKRANARRYGLDKPLKREGIDPIEQWQGDPDRYFSDERIAVYTACFGGYDCILPPVICPDNIDYYVITDQAERAETPWKVLSGNSVVPEPYRKDPVLANRWCKLHPHLLFPEYSLSIYVDSNILVVSDLTALTHTMRDFPVAMFRHKNRDCVYDEVRACILKGKDSEDALKRHAALLTAHGVPRNYGLLEAPIIVRRHADERCSSLMDAWWDAFLNGSRRDQISLIDVLWQRRIPVSAVGTLGYDLRRYDGTIQMPHVGDEP